MEESKLLRRAKPSDFDFFYSIKCETANIYWCGYKTAPDRDRLRNWFKENLRNEKREILIYEVSGHPIGYSYIDKTPGFYETSVAVSEKYESKGFGKEIISKTNEHIKLENKISVIYAWIFNKNTASIRIHEKAGFRPTDETKEHALGDGMELMTRFRYDIAEGRP